MERIVEVPGYGNVSFPDTMDMPAIAAAIKGIKPPAPPSTPQQIGAKQPRVPIGPGQVATGEQFMNPLTAVGSTLAEGAKGAVEFLGHLDENPVGTLLDMIPGIVNQAKQAGHEIGEGEPITGMTRAGMLLAPTELGKDFLGGDAAGIPTPPGAIRSMFNTTIPDRIGASLLEPTEKNLRFNADPVKASRDAGIVGLTIPSILKRTNEAIGKWSNKLTDTVKGAYQEVGDVGPLFDKAFDDDIAKAELKDNPSQAAHLKKLKENLKADLTKRNSGTILNAEQNLLEKRKIGALVQDFKENSPDIGDKATLQDLYHQFDKHLDKLTGNKTAAINDTIRGLMEGSDRLQQLQLARAKSPLVSPSVISNISKIPGSTAIKTGLINLLRDRSETIPQPIPTTPLVDTIERHPVTGEIIFNPPTPGQFHRNAQGQIVQEPPAPPTDVYGLSSYAGKAIAGKGHPNMIPIFDKYTGKIIRYEEGK